LYPFRSLNLRVGLNQEQTVFGIASSQLLEQNYDELILTDPEGATLLSDTIDLGQFDYILEDQIEAYYAQEGKLPFTELSEDNVYPAISHDLGNYIHIMWISVAVYVVVLALSIYIVFFLRRKYLGKTKPSEHLIKEQHKYKNSDS